MLRQAESELLTLFRGSALASRLRTIGPLPELAEADLVRHFSLEAPALYVDSAPFRMIEPGLAELRFEILLLARQTRDIAEGKRGDGVAIGLYDLVDSCLSLIDGAITASCGWRAVSVDFLRDPAFFKAGFVPASIVLGGRVRVDAPVSESDLADFKTFAADYDVDPHQAASEHNKWLQEPPDHSTSTPELSDQLTLQE